MLWKQNTIGITKSDILAFINIVKRINAISRDNDTNDIIKVSRVSGTLEDYSTVVDDCDIINRDLIDICNTNNINIKNYRRIMRIDLYKIILNLLLVVLMTVSLIMITDGSVDTINSNNVIGFILVIITFFIAIIINNDKNSVR